ncbi:MAG: peptide chain release factor H, partial [Hyphomicrobiaceae bacterium]
MAVDLLITSGNGPVECRIAVVALLREIETEARRQGVTIEATRGPEPDRHGPKSAVVTLDGENEDAIARAFTGTIRFVFKSPVRTG